MQLTHTFVKFFRVQIRRGPDYDFNRFHSAISNVFTSNLLVLRRWEKIILRKTSEIDKNYSNTWKLPSGYTTDICIYNPLLKSKVPLVLRNKSFATWYMCGPTVYDSAHLGHACCYVKFDIIRRILERFFGINVVMAMSVTDIDDKIINRAKEQKENITSVSRHYEAEFWEDMKILNVNPPNASLRVTQHIEEIVNFISRIIGAGMAYTTEDGSVYFDTGSYGNYGKFVSVRPEEGEIPEEMSHGRRVADATAKHKRSPVDFALWKASPLDMPHWSSPWGPGRPGWHIECSAMASKLFGSRVDLHSGGIDLAFPHHENEEAQSCAHHGVPQWVSYWIHSGHLHLKGQQKMSKSLKNTLSIQEFLSSYTANQFRMFCLLSHYRSGVAYTEETMGNAVATMNKIECFLADASAYILGKKDPVYLDESELEKNISQFEDRMRSSFADDFNTPAAMSALIELISYCNRILNSGSKLSEANMSLERNSTIPIAAVAILITRTLENLGVHFSYNQVMRTQELTYGKAHTIDWSSIFNSAIAFRTEVRGLTLEELKNKSRGEVGVEYLKNVLSACDDFRKNMAAEGITVKDHNKSSSWVIAEADNKIKK